MPENFEVFPQGSSIVLGTWKEPSGGAAVDYYFVYVENEDMEDETDDNYYYWYDLKACTTYTFGVKVVTSAGDMSDPAVDQGQTLTECKLLQFFNSRARGVCRVTLIESSIKFLHISA